MTQSRWLVLLLPVAIAWACGGDDAASLDGGDDATTEDTGTNDAGTKDAMGASDSPALDASTMDADASDSSAGDAAAEAAVDAGCRQPADCADGGASTVCCATLLTNGNQVSCQVTAATTTCLNPLFCTDNYGTFFSCNAMTAATCATNGDCTDSNYPTCCTATFDGGSLHVCASSQIQNLTGGIVTCP